MNTRTKDGFRSTTVLLPAAPAPALAPPAPPASCCLNPVVCRGAGTDVAAAAAAGTTCERDPAALAVCGRSRPCDVGRLSPVYPAPKPAVPLLVDALRGAPAMPALLAVVVVVVRVE